VDPLTKKTIAVVRELRREKVPHDSYIVAEGVVDDLHASGEITVEEVESHFAEVQQRYEHLMSNSSPCWKCGTNEHEHSILYVEAIGEYQHDVDCEGR